MPLARRIWFAQVCNDFTLLGFGQAGCLKFHSIPIAYFTMISHRWASVKRVASSFIPFPLWFIESKGLKSDMSKVRTYQLSAHQRLRFKVRTLARDYCIYDIWCQLLFGLTQCYIFLLLMYLIYQVQLLMCFHFQPNSLTLVGKIRDVQ